MTNLAKAFSLLTQPVTAPPGREADKDYINGLMRFRILEAARCLRAGCIEIQGLLSGLNPRVGEVKQLVDLPHVEEL